jgi:3-mercaptopyruvate sulfurtransferase SseA
MRLWSLMAGVIIVAAAILSGCGGNNQTATNSGKGSSGNSPVMNARNTAPDNVRRVTITELRDMLDQGKAVVLDVRGDEAYKQEHIKGALNFPENQLSARAGELPKDKLIVFYCS